MSVVRSTGGARVGGSSAPWQAQIYFPNVAKEFKPLLEKRVPLWALQHYCGGALVAKKLGYYRRALYRRQYETGRIQKSGSGKKI